MLQMGGSDQWGNMTTGTELIRRKGRGHAFALTAPLITKADGSNSGRAKGATCGSTRPAPVPTSSTSTGSMRPTRTRPVHPHLHPARPGTHRGDRGCPCRESRRPSPQGVGRRRHLPRPREQDLPDGLGRHGPVVREVHRGRPARPPEWLLSVFEGVPQRKVTREALTAGIGIIDLLAGGEAPSSPVAGRPAVPSRRTP